MAGSLGLLVLGVGAMWGRVAPSTMGMAAGAWLLWGLGSAVFFRQRRAQGMKDFMTERRGWNLIFFAGFVLLNAASDALMIGSAPPGWLAATGFMTGRVLTQLILACVLWFLLLLGSRWWPRGAGWVAWGAVVLTPLLIIADMTIRLAWTKSLYQLCAEVESRGRLDLLKIQEGAGVAVTTWQWVLLGLVVLAAPAWYFLSGWISRRRGWRMSGARLLAVALAAWVLLMGLNVAESALKGRAWRTWEGRAVMLQLTPFAPPRGVVTFAVAVRDPQAAGPVIAVRKPDIFFFIIETLRADAVNAEQTPHFAKFAEDCQPITETRAASNSTHLSWFGILHGRVPYHFAEASRVTAPAPLLALLHQAGFAVEVRSAGNFDYAEMMQSNFGDGTMLRVMEHVPAQHPERVLETPEREKLMMRRLRESVAQSPPGGVLWLTAIDSAHYPYKWPADWTPPFADYERAPVFPVMPSPEEVARVRRRYQNSVAWNDYLFGEFITWLKSQGRYEDALVIVTGDHGEEFKEHGSWFHCSALNPQQTRVPILIKWPAAMGNVAAIEDASHLDLLPTILDAVSVPESVWSDLPGRSLRRAEAATSIMQTCYAGQNDEVMVWRRDGWEAAFSWSAPWELAAPERMWLERIEGPEGRVECAGPAEYEAELRRRFPDAVERVFLRWERVE